MRIEKSMKIEGFAEKYQFLDNFTIKQIKNFIRNNNLSVRNINKHSMIFDLSHNNSLKFGIYIELKERS